jgi:hypothetical protein
MKYLITEGQNSKVKDQILRTISEHGVFRTLRRYSLNPKGLDIIFKDDFPDFDCDDLDSIIAYYYASNFIKRIKRIVFNDKKYKVLISMDGHTGTLNYQITDLKNKDGIEVYATPFFEGNCFVPVEVVAYYNTNRGDDTEWHDDMNPIFDTFDITPGTFSSFTDILDWYENDFMEKLFEIVIPELSNLRERFKGGDPSYYMQILNPE